MDSESVAPFIVYAPEGSNKRVLLHGRRARWVLGNASLETIAKGLQDTGRNRERVAMEWAGIHGLDMNRAMADVVHADEALEGAGMYEACPQEETRLESLFLMLTERCNLHCLHCSGGPGGERSLGISLACSMVDELVSLGARSVTLSGGEPLLYPELPRLLDHLGRRLHIQFCTNGTLVDESFARYCSGSLNASFQISLDGSCAARHDAVRGGGAFDAAIRGVESLRRAGLGDRITLAVTLQQANRDDLEALVALAGELGVPRMRFLPVRRIGNASAHWKDTGACLDSAAYQEAFMSLIQASRPGLELSCGLSGFGFLEASGRRHYCTVGQRLVVDALGDVYPCVLLMDPSFRLGNVAGAALQDLFHGATLETLRQAKEDRSRCIRSCQGCTWRNFCQSGCMGQAFEENGDIYSRDALCACRREGYKRTFARVCGQGLP